MKKALLSSVVISAVCFSSSVVAAEHLSGYAGVYGAGRSESSPEIGIEYRGNEIFANLLEGHVSKNIYKGVRPTLGYSFSADSASYLYAGFTWDIQLSEKIYLTPSWVVGGYHKAADRDLGGALEFQSGLELGYALSDNARVSLAVKHRSNAAIYDENPGVESVSLVYSHPIDLF